MGIVSRTFSLIGFTAALTAAGGPAQAQTPDEAATPREADGIVLRARLGPGLEVRHGALGGWVGGILGYETSSGLGVGLTVGARYHTTTGYSVSDVGLGGLFRVSAFPASRFHPFGEIGPALHVVTETIGAASARNVVFGGDFGLGLQVDVTRRLSLDFAGRGEVLLPDLQRVQVVLTPFAGVVLRL